MVKGVCVGMGGRGRHWYNWARDAGIDVVGVVDLNEQILNDSADTLKVPQEQRFTSIAAAKEGTDATVAAVCTANVAHYACIEQCLAAGFHLIIEKPMVEQLEQAKDVLTKVEESGLELAVAQNYRYTAPMRAMRKAIAAGRIGKVHTVTVRFARWRPAGNMTLPLMLNQGIHHFDAARYILDADPAWCFAHSWNTDWSPTEGPTMLQSMWGMRGGDSIGNQRDGTAEAIFTYHGNYVYQGQQTPYGAEWHVAGSEGSLYLTGLEGEDRPVKLATREPDSVEIIEPELADVPEPALVCRDFIDAVSEGRPAPTTATDNIKSLAMIWSAQASSDSQQRIDIASLLA